jgi:hypothetical protein
MRYSGPQLLSSWLHGAAPRQPSCQLPRRARAVGPAELTVRRRCPVGSRTTGLATRDEIRHALASAARDRDRGDRAKLGSGKSFGSNKKRKQATRLTCATADPNCCHLGCTARAPRQPSCHLPRRARAVGPAELTVRRGTPMSSPVEFPRTAIGRFIARARARIAKKPIFRCHLIVDDAGLRIDEVRVDRPTASLGGFEWEAVARVVAYKRDLYIYDLVCVAFEFADGTAFEIHEEMMGWQDLIDSLCQRLPGCAPFDEWWPKVASPAFETNETTLFDRQSKGVTA